MRQITVFYGNYYTDKHNNAMRYLVNNLFGVAIVANTDDATVLNVTDEAYAVIEALSDADCLSIG